MSINSDEIIDYIRELTLEPYYLSDPNISNHIQKRYNLMYTASNIGLIRKNNGIKSGVKNLDDLERKRVVRAWKKKKDIHYVMKTVGITLHKARSKIKTLHNEGLIDAKEALKVIEDAKRKRGEYQKKKQKKKKERKPYHITEVSRWNLAKLTKAKFDRVAYLCDMRTL